MMMKNILAQLVTECPFSEVFQDTERSQSGIGTVPKLKVGHIRADYYGRWYNTVWPCHAELATSAISREVDAVYAALTAKDALADLDTLTCFCQSHPEACVDPQFRQEYNFYLVGDACDFWIRLITRPRDYNLYLHAFARSKQQ